MDPEHINKFYQHLVGNWNNEFVFPDFEPQIINILYGWSGIYGKFGLCFSISSSVIWSKLNFFI